eukprot:CAMPEP_0171106982 /NCGR_PEP_ID=MMETSP0766_2-20121228/65929_1 /TAXON_ID=439317 /ORGANISM="Gambierdiscus australes, Strain CAWD 149" /LENGTH=82 /DNA_ID=CAMNT_0011568201 /DNA_START=45 /DNA_END=293 /DNA_ORIENTATION=+
MASKEKVSFKVVLAAEKDKPFKVISTPQEAPFQALLRFAMDEFKVDVATSTVVTNDGASIDPNQTAWQVFLKHGADLKLQGR